ncbi:hypothetical protein RB653_004688 [Dictyostelium firmibasis]|uniref:t-SNARE coiled-coil homology domain-containing protein n=1 Tax=Dictyostelium firmibasis TaxID=79012 RepID=A0AAN7UJS7_9MYCE
MHNTQTFTPEEEQEISERVQEYEDKYGSLDRTTRMLEQLRDSHATGVDNLMKLGQHSEQMNRVEKLTNEQEQMVKGLGKYKKFNKYMKRFSKKDKEDDKAKPNKNQEIHNEVKRLKIKNEVDVKIFNKRQNDEKEKREKRLEEYNQKLREDQAAGNPFAENGDNTTTTTTTTTTSSNSVRKTSPKQTNGMTEDEMFEKKGLSKLWSKESDPLSKNEKNQINYAIENQAMPMNRLSDECMKDNVIIQRSTWIKKQDVQLDEMQDILTDLKNISLATQTEVQTQSLKLDEIGASMDRGSDFSLKKKSKRSIEKEQKKKEKQEKDKIKKEEKTKQEIDKQVKKDYGVGVGSK